MRKKASKNKQNIKFYQLISKTKKMKNKKKSTINNHNKPLKKCINLSHSRMLKSNQSSQKSKKINNLKYQLRGMSHHLLVL